MTIEHDDYPEANNFFASDVKSAVEYFLKYKDRPVLLQDNDSEVYKRRNEAMKNDSKYMNARDTFQMYADMDLYNDWLFDYCFGDVIE